MGARVSPPYPYHPTGHNSVALQHPLWVRGAAASGLDAQKQLASPIARVCTRGVTSVVIVVMSLLSLLSLLSSGVVRCRYVVMPWRAVVSLCRQCRQCRHVSLCCHALVSLCRHRRHMSSHVVMSLCRYVVMSLLSLSSTSTSSSLHLGKTSAILQDKTCKTCKTW